MVICCILFLLYIPDYKLKNCENEFASTCSTATWRITVCFLVHKMYSDYALEPFQSVTEDI